MEPQTITKKQEKKTLGGRKLKKETIKNILVSPFKKFWPLLTHEDEKQLNKILKLYLPRLQNDKINVPYKQIKAIPKDERRKFRETFNKQEPVNCSKSDREGLIFGVNNVSRCILNNEAACVLISSEVTPRLLVQHVLEQAVLHKTPVLVVRNLKTTLQTHCGISGTTVAITKKISPNTKLSLIEQCVSNTAENYRPPELHINAQRAFNPPVDADASVVLVSDADSSVILIDSDPETSQLNAPNEPNVSVNETKAVVPTFKHLKRGSTLKRAFIPPDSVGGPERMDSITSGGFIAVQESAPVKRTPQYISLSVKRVRGNKNRTLRKTERVK